MENVIKTNTMFRIALKFQSADVVSLGLPPRDSLATASRFSTPAPTVTLSHPVPVPESTPPPAAPNKLHINAVMDLKNFNTKSVPALAKTQNIQHWYNALQFRR
jgi:hypothetical protein